jgi:hypothetical protein
MPRGVDENMKRGTIIRRLCKHRGIEVVEHANGGMDLIGCLGQLTPLREMLWQRVRWDARLVIGSTFPGEKVPRIEVHPSVVQADVDTAWLTLSIKDPLWVSEDHDVHIETAKAMFTASRRGDVLPVDVETENIRDRVVAEMTRDIREVLLTSARQAYPDGGDLIRENSEGDGLARFICIEIGDACLEAVSVAEAAAEAARMMDTAVHELVEVRDAMYALETMELIRCSNPECESRTEEGGDPLFNITAVVDRDRCLAENLKKASPEHFECAHCGSKGEADDDVEKCPECGADLHQCKTGEPGCMHCGNDDCTYMREPG